MSLLESLATFSTVNPMVFERGNQRLPGETADVRMGRSQAVAVDTQVHRIRSLFGTVTTSRPVICGNTRHTDTLYESIEPLAKRSSTRWRPALRASQRQ